MQCVHACASRSNFVFCFVSSRVPLMHSVLVLGPPSSGLGTLYDVRGSERSFTLFFFTVESNYQLLTLSLSNDLKRATASCVVWDLIN